MHPDTELVSGGVADTLHAALPHGVGHGEENIFAELLHHVQDAPTLETPFGHIPLPQFEPFHLLGMSIDLSITKHVVFLWVSAAVLCLLAVLVARRVARQAVPTGFAGLVEVMAVYVRDEIALYTMGPRGILYTPYLMTTFFFILLMNLMGLIPYGATATSNVNVTAGLAIVAFVMIQASAIRAQGVGHYLAHLTAGVHWALWPIMVPIEIIGLFTKPFALCVRLFANMNGGHIVIVSLIGLIFLFQSYLVAIAPAGFVVGILFLELFVALLQAYIFTMLTATFMGLGMAEAEHQGQEAHG